MDENQSWSDYSGRSYAWDANDIPKLMKREFMKQRLSYSVKFSSQERVDVNHVTLFESYVTSLERGGCIFVERGFMFPGLYMQRYRKLALRS